MRDLARCLRPTLAGAVVLLTGCASLQGLAPSASTTDAAKLEASRALGGTEVSKTWPAIQWWKAWGDAQLDALMDEALTNSPSVRVAEARLREAQGLAKVAGAPRWPQVSGDAESSHQRFSENGIFPPPLGGSTFTQTQLGVNFDYELDFWGKNRATFDASLGRAKAAAVDAFAARLLLSTNIAHAYVQLQRAYEQLDVAKAHLDDRQAIVELTKSRVEAGLDSRLELRQTEAAVPAARERVVQMEEQVSLARNLLAALLGKGPDRGLTIERPHLQRTQTIALPSLLPADLVGHRPDVVAQRWRVEAAASDVSNAKAQFYPNVNLAAFLGVQSVSLSKLLEPGSAIPSYGAAIHLPIFEGGRLRGSLAARDAQYDVAVEQYNQTLVEALREVVDQLAALRSVDAQRTELTTALAAAQEAYDLAMKRYQAGIGSYLQVLSAEAPVLEQKSLDVDLRMRALDASINLVRALGGGYAEAFAKGTDSNNQEGKSG
jgi:NodT family efflux transporter outer membrane factor (OMF) lipoprotein